MTAFGKRSTAEEVSLGIDLRGRHALVTGANTGIGLETTRVLALRGASVTLACRNTARAEAARASLLDAHPGEITPDQLDIAALDLASLESVRRSAAEWLAIGRPLHLLVNNAGIMIPDRRETADGFEAHFGTNHLGHFLLTRLLLERIRASAPARIVNVSSDAQRFASLTRELTDLSWTERRFSGWRSYGDSKLMNVLFSNELDRRFAAEGIVSNALHPGIVRTELGRDQSLWMKVFGLALLPITKSPAEGAATSILLATSPEHGERGGGYYADCAPSRPHRLAGDSLVAGALWKKSEELTGL
jgi:NAD(P)-dependent dehydrogenase (short-subunit alcohol dehydrogenase family)